jgi:predicted nucleic acid-binding protein
VAVSAVTVGELLVGAYCAQMPDRETEKVQAFLKPIRVLDYGTAEARQFARISAVLRRQGQLIGVPDAMIAATAEAHRSTVITKNLKHFEKVENLKVVNWAAQPPKGT